jgi:hypothetical protein
MWTWMGSVEEIVAQFIHKPKKHVSKEGWNGGYTHQEWYKELGSERDYIDTSRLPIKKKGKKPHKLFSS